METESLRKFTYTLAEVIALTGISRTSLYKEIKVGKLTACKIGSRTLVRHNDLEIYMSNLKPLHQAQSK